MGQSNNNRSETKPIIGATEWVNVGNYKKVPAKIDTGAQSSTIWASDVKVDADGTLRFKLFDKDYYKYTGRVFKREAGTYKVGMVRSSNGTEQIRYRVYLIVEISGKKVRALFSLADRSHNNFPILIGRRTVSNKFLVDCSTQNVHTIKVDTQNPETEGLNAELAKDPAAFYQKYFKEGKK